MSNEEQTQIFRGDDAPPEMGIAETGGPRVSRRADAPVVDRGLHDQKNGPSDTRQLRDAQDELAELRQLHDARGEAADGTARDRQDGPIDAQHLHDADGPSDRRQFSDADGLAEARHLDDADGPSIARHTDDGDGPSDRRQMHDHHADMPPAAATGTVTLNGFGDVVEDEHDEDALAATERVEALPSAPVSDPDLTFEAEDDATPWALAIHLEARIASLSESTLKVNEQLNGLDESIKRLAKRIGK